MDESVVMVSGVLKEVGIDNAQGDTPLLVGYIRVDVPCSYDMENGEQEYSHKNRHGHPVLHQVGKERYEQKYGSRMLQELLSGIHGVDECDSRESYESQDENEFALVHFSTSHLSYLCKRRHIRYQISTPTVSDDG